MDAMDGTAYDIFYNEKRMPLYAKSAEGHRSYFWYNKKGQPTTMSIEADKNSAAVTVGRVYYIRQQRSGKYIDTQQGDTTRGSHGDRDGGSKCVTTGLICVPNKKSESSRKELSGFFVFIRMQ